MAGNRERECREERATLCRREVEVVDEYDRRPLRGQSAGRVHEDGLPRLLRQEGGVLRCGLSAKQGREGRHEGGNRCEVLLEGLASPSAPNCSR